VSTSSRSSRPSGSSDTSSRKTPAAGAAGAAGGSSSGGATRRPRLIRVSFVCLGNICRSPTAEGIMRHLVERAGLSDAIEVESAGTGSWHLGEQADDRARATAAARGVTLDGRASQFSDADFERLDYILVMDVAIRNTLGRLAASDAARAKLHLLRSFDPDSAPDAPVPDPYYGGPEGFENVFDICEAACRGLLAHIRQTHHLPA
jgi:protein-tyrosine phosphatase